MANFQVRLERERRTIRTMIGMYCQAQHHTQGTLCQACQELHTYAMQRIDKCPFREDKPTCAKCPIHCYKLTMREQVRQVMRYAGPRMLFRHPLLTVMHYWDERTISREREKRKE
jgi:hypothetical protein